MSWLRRAMLRRIRSLALYIIDQHTPEPTTPRLPIPIHPVTVMAAQRNRTIGLLLTSQTAWIIFLTMS